MPPFKMASRATPRTTFEQASSGVHVRGTTIWCDVARASGVCFVSRADVPLGRGRPQQVITTERTAALRAKIGARFVNPLVPRFGRPLSIGRVRLELLPSGRVEGGAQLLVELNEWRGLYAASVWPSPAPTAEPAQVRACDELVIDAPHHGVRDSDEHIDAALAEAAVLHVADLTTLALLRQRLGARLRVDGAWRRLQPRGPVTTPTISAQPSHGQGLRSLHVVAGLRPASATHCLALGGGPDVPTWLAWVEQSGASRVRVRAPHDHPQLAQLLAALRGRGVDADALSPPLQLSLFNRTRFTVLAR